MGRPANPHRPLHQPGQETGQTLYFLCVVNLDFMSHSSKSRVQSISERISQMGEFILMIAQDKAAQQGVEARVVLRQGDVDEEIEGLCHEIQADYLVLGWPQLHREDAAFTEEQLRQFAARAEEKCGATVVFPGGQEA